MDFYTNSRGAKRVERYIMTLEQRAQCCCYHTSDMALWLMEFDLGLSQIITRVVPLLERRDTVREVVSVRIESQLLCSRRPTVLQRFWVELWR